MNKPTPSVLGPPNDPGLQTGPPGPPGPAGVGGNPRGAYNAGTTYALNDTVIGSNGHWYISLANGNIGNDPTTDGGVHWADLLPPSVEIACPVVADNSTDNSATIQAAVDAASAAGGGEVRVRVASGTTGIAIGRFTLKPHVRVQFPGASALRLKAPAGSTDVIGGLNFAALTGKLKAAGDYLLGCPDAGVTGVTIDGNNTANYGYRVWGRAPYLADVYVQNCVQGGIWTEFTDVDNFLDPAQVLSRTWSGEVVVNNCGGDAWTCRGPHDQTVESYSAYENTGWAIRIEAHLDGSNSIDGYNGGVTILYANSFLNTAGSFYAHGSAFEVVNGAATGANVGTGIDFGPTSGGGKFTGTVAGHSPGVILRGLAQKLDIEASNNPGDVIQQNGGSQCRIYANGSDNTNFINVISAGTGENVIEANLDLPAAGTLATGGAFHVRDRVFLQGNGSGGDHVVKQDPAEGQGFIGGVGGNSINTDAGIYRAIGLVVANNGAITINAPTNPSLGKLLLYDVVNQVGGAMGTITWDAIFKLAGAFTNPANGHRRTISFYWDGYNWVELNRAAADI